MAIDSIATNDYPYQAMLVNNSPQQQGASLLLTRERSAAAETLCSLNLTNY